ncbi:MAG: endolytic transglycosylase MltG [Minisyncoccota bacterium]
MDEQNTDIKSTEEVLLLEEPSFFHLYKKIILTLLLSFFTLVIVIYITLIRVPSNFPTQSIVSIENGDSLEIVTQRLKSLNIIRSPFVFRSVVILSGGEKNVTAGDYILIKKENPFEIARRIIKGDYGMEEVRVTIQEGLSVSEISTLLSKKLIFFDEGLFKEKAKDEEGYLFPDTYFFSPTTKPAEVISRMKKNFEEKIKSIQSDIDKSNKSLNDILIMASILEGEAVDTESRRIVSGILWKRISLGMPLQVDATFKYINGKNSYNLTLDDLKIDSLYNTYINRGLPPTPINNPGLDAILSTINPTKTDYLYFLTGKDGKMYYAKTFEEHKLNKVKYLK